jgi:hypothetical protein
MSKQNRYVLYYQDEDGTKHPLGSSEFSKDLRLAIIRELMMNSYWDARLDSASCTPVLERVGGEL